MTEPSGNGTEPPTDAVAPDSPFSDDLRQELKELCSFAKDVFAKFVDWWKFFVTANIGLLAALKGLDSLRDTYPRAAIVVAVLDVLGLGFCFITCCRFAQIADRYDEILAMLYPQSKRTTRTLPNLSNAKAMWEMVRYRLGQEPSRQLEAPNSPIPIRYYLICVFAVAPGCILLAALWLIGLLGKVQ